MPAGFVMRLSTALVSLCCSSVLSLSAAGCGITILGKGLDDDSGDDNGTTAGGGGIRVSVGVLASAEVLRPAFPASRRRP